MKKILLLAFFAGFVSALSAQQIKQSVLYKLVKEKFTQSPQLTTVNAFKPLKAGLPEHNTVVRQFVKLSLDKNQLQNTFRLKPDLLTVPVPFGSKQYTLKLSKQHINTSGDFAFGIIENGIRKKISGDEGLHYRGYIDDDPSSMACFSIFENGEVMCLFGNNDGDFNLGKDGDGSGDYVVFESNDMVNPPRSSCGLNLLPVNEQQMTNDFNAPIENVTDPMATPSLLCNKVRLYWEADNSLYVDKFSSNIISIKNYITGLFNQVAAVYQNEGVQVDLSESYVWTTQDPYDRSSSSSAITSFRTYWNNLGNSFNGDLAHLLTASPGDNGGIAYLLGNPCSRTFAYGYSNVHGNYQSYPAFSWDVYVISHETGHNLGSNHTHWCGWKTASGGACGSIDNCYTQENYDTCSTCFTTTDIASPPAQFKGTIMSYCHLVSGIGINLSNGFGPLPQAVVRNAVSAGFCLRQGASWTGAVSTAWENAGNWSCGVLPTATTDVTVGTGLTNYPEVNSTTATCHAITLANTATLKVNPGFKLTVTGISP